MDPELEQLNPPPPHFTMRKMRPEKGGPAEEPQCVKALWLILMTCHTSWPLTSTRATWHVCVYIHIHTNNNTDDNNSNNNLI